MQRRTATQITQAQMRVIFLLESISSIYLMTSGLEPGGVSQVVPIRERRRCKNLIFYVFRQLFGLPGAGEPEETCLWGADPPCDHRTDDRQAHAEEEEGQTQVNPSDGHRPP